MSRDLLKRLGSRLTSRRGPVRVDRGADAPPGLQVDSEVVTWAYRLFLDREPEDAQRIEEKMRLFPALSGLRKDLLASREYRTNNPPFDLVTLDGKEPAMDLEEDASPECLAKILEHVRLSWQYLGEREPHWSVLTSEKFLPSRIHETREEFYGSGRDPVDTLFAALGRNRIDPAPLRTCVEYGCGLGRITRWLAERFDHVHGYDISAAHLAGASRHLSDSGAGNVTLRHVRTADEMAALERADVVYSMIVLQHNPPPVIRLIVRAFLRSLRPGGVAYFQVPTYRQGYQFRASEYVKRESKKHKMMEMHVLPQRAIFRLAREEGCELVEVLEDAMTGLRYKEVSNTFLIRKRPGAAA